MVHGEALLVTLVRLVDRIPLAPLPVKRRRGRPCEYTEQLIVKALVIMIVRRLYSAYSLLVFLEQETPLTVTLRPLLMEQGRFPSRRTWERRLGQLPHTLPSLIACLGLHLVRQIQPWGRDGRAATIDSTPLRAKGGVWHKKDRVSYPTRRLTPKPTGANPAIMAGGTAGNCTLSARQRRSGFRWRHA